MITKRMNCINYGSQVRKTEVLVVPMIAYTLVLEWPLYNTRMPQIDWAPSRLTLLRTPPSQVVAQSSGVIVQWYEGRDNESTNMWLQMLLEVLQ
jgi:hypothetical protein